MTNKKLERVDLHSEVTLSELKCLEAAARDGSKPKSLALGEIEVADGVFQWRLADENMADDESHFHELTRVLQQSQSPLDALLVLSIGDRYFVIDGHHRLEAYHAVGWKRKVPVRYFVGSVEEARKEALKLNSKNKLPMTQEEKFEAAWRLLKDDTNHLQREICELTSVSRRTIGYMTTALKDHPEAAAMPWRQARRLGKDAEADDWNPDDWKEKQAQEVAKQIFKNVHVSLLKHPDIIARALEIVSPKLIDGLRSWLADTYEDDEAEPLDI